jgi:hypothetical protein
MKKKSSVSEQTCELLILADGNIFAHNLTPAMAGLLAGLNPNDAAMRQRAEREASEVPVATRETHPDRHPPVS